MNFNEHSDLEGQHAFLGASQYHWLNYDEDKLTEVYRNFKARQRGTELHDFAKTCIKLKQRLPRSKQTLNMYVNDAIGYRMVPEQVLVYSDNAYGTCDAICFKKDLLRIHDLKTGITPASMNQLMIYMALFCLEYSMKPTDFQAELRIYQNNEIIFCNNESEPELPDIIAHIMDKIIFFDKKINELKMEE
jgi:hypothetical protein